MLSVHCADFSDFRWHMTTKLRYVSTAMANVLLREILPLVYERMLDEQRRQAKRPQTTLGQTITDWSNSRICSLCSVSLIDTVR